ncbi:MAG: SH3 domain-containing protein [Sphingobium sp.]|nr:hypothetical protein [Sphingobium sp.]MCP5399071.1 hypothetical protein [Sphingomonas sp.]
MSNIKAALLPAACLYMLAASPLHAETLPPRNECAADPAYFAFEQQLRQAVAERNPAQLLALVDTSIKSSFGGDDGIEEFRTSWQLDKAETSPIWLELERILALGCAKKDGYAALPYMFAHMPDRYDAFSSFVATGTNIVMREGPSRDARAVARLDWDIMTQVDDGEATSEDWVKVSSTVNHNVGYVHKSLLRSPIDYRLIVQPVDGVLKIVTFVAGD